MTVDKSEIAVIPRGIKFSVEVDGPCRGWISEVYKGHWRLPELGPIGANGLAYLRDFEIPEAYYEHLNILYLPNLCQICLNSSKITLVLMWLDGMVDIILSNIS